MGIHHYTQHAHGQMWLFRRTFMAIKIQYWYRKNSPKNRWRRRIGAVNRQIEDRPYGQGGNPGPGMAGICFLKNLKNMKK
ncbi:hypothetical protein CL622_03755 [archaeon]|nr:hypothetical protein [archaeon]